jgi:thiosulfate reductase cytochrome b subunit
VRFPHGEAARHYNVLQKLSYLAVLFGLLPLMAATGLTMSPGMDARLHFLTEIFGGRQSARTIHFLAAMALVVFFVVHIVAVLAAGPLTELRSIITGWFVIRTERRSS